MRGHPELFITISILSCYFIMCFVWIRMIYRIVERRQNLLLYLHSCGDILTYDSATEVWWSSWMSLHDCHVFPRIALMLCCNKHAAWGLVVFNAGATECERLEAGRLSEEDQNRTSESDRPHGLRDSLSLLLRQMCSECIRMATTVCSAQDYAKLWRHGCLRFKKLQVSQGQAWFQTLA